MALQVTIGLSQENSCGTLVIRDTTGAYDSSNLTGWKTATSGGSNIRIDDSSITTALLTIAGDTFSKSFDLMDVDIWQAITPYTTGQPFDDTVIPTGLYYTINTVDLSTSIIPDGIITIELYLEDSNGITCDNTFTAALYCKIKCCRDKVIAAISDYYQCQNCNSQYVNSVCLIDGLYKSLELAACSADTTKFDTILATLQNIFEAMNITCT